MRLRIRHGEHEHVNRILSLDGSADEWAVYEIEVLWFEQSFITSERPQQFSPLLKALTGLRRDAMQSENTTTFFWQRCRTNPSHLPRQNVGIFTIRDPWKRA